MSHARSRTVLQRLLRDLAGEVEASKVEVTLSDLIRRVLATPDPSDGLPTFMPYLDDQGQQVWAERARLSQDQWRRSLEYLSVRVQAELE